MPNKAQEDAVINLKTLQEISSQLGFEWTVLAYELGFNRTEIRRFHTKSTEKSVQARTMLESWYSVSVQRLYIYVSFYSTYVVVPHGGYRGVS